MLVANLKYMATSECLNDKDGAARWYSIYQQWINNQTSTLWESQVAII